MHQDKPSIFKPLSFSRVQMPRLSQLGDRGIDQEFNKFPPAFNVTLGSWELSRLKSWLHQSLPKSRMVNSPLLQFGHLFFQHPFVYTKYIGPSLASLSPVVSLASLSGITFISLSECFHYHLGYSFVLIFYRNLWSNLQ